MERGEFDSGGWVLIGWIVLNVAGYLYYDVLLPGLGTFIHLVY